MAVINIDDAYILDETGEQVDQVTGLYLKNENASDTEKEQARANIGAGGTNRNLLDNWYFVGGGSQLGDGIFPINQRGQTSYTGAAATGVDRWWQQYNTNVQLTSAGLRITGDWDIQQRFARPLPDGTYTLSVDVASKGDTTPLMMTINASYQQIGSNTITQNGINTFTFTSDSSNPVQGVAINLAAQAGADVTIRAMKLEKGTISTLANDVPPDFGEELQKCKRRLRYVPLKRTPVILDGGYSVAVVTLTGIEMASFPTASLVTAGTAYAYNPLTSATPTSASVIAFDYNTPTIQLGLNAALNGMGVVYDTVIQLSCEP